MKNWKTAIQAGIALAIVSLSTGCIVAPREGYYDRDHARYYHDHAWVACGERDERCR